MKKPLKRKIAITLILALTLAGLCGCGKKELESGQIADSPYPCAWQEKRNGSFEITVTGELPENAVWSVITGAGTIQAEQKSGESVFTVKPVEEGSGQLTLWLREEGLPVEKGANFYFSFSVDEDKNMTLSSASCTALEAEAYTSEAGTGVYWKESSIGGLFVYLTGTEWTVEGYEGVGCLGPTKDGDDVRLEILALEESEEGSLILCSEDTGDRLKLVFKIKDGTMTVESCETAAVEAEEQSLTPQEQAFVDAYEAAETDEEREKILSEYMAEINSETELATDEELLEAAVAAWTEVNGKEPTEKELEEIRKTILGDE